MEQELETKTKRTRTTRTEASLHLSNNMAQCPVWDSPRHRGLDSICSYQCDNRSRASMAKHTFHVDGDTLYPVLVRIFEQEEPVSAVLTMRNGSVFTLLVEASDTIDNDGTNAEASDKADKTITQDAEASDYQIKLHVIHAGVTIAVCDPYCEADGMTLEEIRDAFEEGLGRYLYKDGYGWKFNMPRQKLKKLIQDRWLLNGEVVGTEYNDGIVKPCDSLEVHMVVDADGDSESCRSESDSEHGDKTITLDAEASDTIDNDGNTLKCENACTTDCFDVRAAFKCGHGMCQKSRSMLSHCIQCGCNDYNEKYAKEKAAGTESFLVACGIIPEL